MFGRWRWVLFLVLYACMFCMPVRGDAVMLNYSISIDGGITSLFIPSTHPPFLDNTQSFHRHHGPIPTPCIQAIRKTPAQ
ncbi:hypothetical protein J3F83DRAFT_731449 [Trichoderma novae-zelandiae]